MDRRRINRGRPSARRIAALAVGLLLALAAAAGAAEAPPSAAAPPANPAPQPSARRLPRPDLRRPSLGVDVQAVRSDSMFAPFRAHLAAGRLAEARAALDDVMARVRQPVEREVAEFDRIELDFFAGQFDSAAAQYRTFAQSHLRGYLTNDAIARMFLLDENSGTDEKALRLYARAAQEVRAGRPDSAAAALRLGIERYQGSEIEDDLRLFLGDVAQRLTPPGPAVEQYRRVAEMDESPLAAAAVLRIARYYSLVEVDPAAATAACEEVLARFPDSVESGEARKLMDQLRRGGRPAS
jgi:TolA-binding protein